MEQTVFAQITTFQRKASQTATAAGVLYEARGQAQWIVLSSVAGVPSHTLYGVLGAVFERPKMLRVWGRQGGLVKVETARILMRHVGHAKQVNQRRNYYHADIPSLMRGQGGRRP